MKRIFEQILNRILETIRDHYGDRLVSVAVYGSVGRGTPRPDSDIDLLVISEGLPNGRIARMDDFRIVEKQIEAYLSTIRVPDLHIEISPVIKSPDEVKKGSPLFLDMTEDARILHDRERFFENELSKLRDRLQQLGSKRIWKGSAWYWDLKPDFQPGETFSL